MEPIVRKESLFEGLKPGEQRRLYFLLLVADQLELREALALAERIDAFITAKTVSKLDLSDLLTTGAGSSPGGARRLGENGGSEPRPITSASVSSCLDEAALPVFTNPPDSPAPAAALRHRLDRSSQIEFFKGIAQGATNAELAERFGLTKRQAHALRLGMTRKARATGLARRANRQTSMESFSPSSDISSLEQQEELLHSKSPLAASEAEVIRFLRQMGDVVVKEDEIFVINSILRLDFQQVLARANTKRLQRGKPTFEFPPLDAAQAVIPANGNGAGRDQT
jgi:hypothetical protein